MIGQHYYTWCAKDAGCEGIMGFQTKAKSPSVDAETEQTVKEYCTRFSLPRSLHHIAAKATDLAPEEVAATPPAVHFYPISRNRFGLTRLRIHPRQQGRPGNFFAHTLVMSADALREVGNNPFAILRSGLFRDGDEGSIKELEDLDGFPALPLESATKILGAVPRDMVLRMLRALTVFSADRRALILLAGSSEEATCAIEGALLLLPLEFRPQVSFSTNEPDPYSRLNRDGRIVIVSTFAPEDGGRFGFQEHEYASTHYVFNSIEPRYSEAEPACPGYVSLATSALRNPDSDLTDLSRAQRVIDALSLDVPYLWDTPLALNQADWQGRLRRLSLAGASVKEILREMYGQLGGPSGETA